MLYTKGYAKVHLYGSGMAPQPCLAAGVDG